MPVKWDVFSKSCPSRSSLAQIANKWTAMIVIFLAAGPARFSELHGAVEGISKKVLVDTLRSLERDGMVERTTRAGHPAYALTGLGRTLESPLTALQDWAESHIETVLSARDRFDESADAAVLEAAVLEAADERAASRAAS